MKNISLLLITLMIVLFITLYIFMNKKGIDKKSKYIILSIYLLINIISFKYLNGILNSIIQLKFLSIKTYLLLIVGVNAIILYTINHKIKTIYQIYNYILFILITIIFGATISIIIGNKIKAFYIMDISNAVNLIDLSIVLFIIYLIITLTTNIGFYILNPKDIVEEKILLPNIPRLKIKIPTIPKFNIKNKKTNNKLLEKNILSPYELLNYDKEKRLFIDGVDASIIFDDSNKENIIKNYYILLDNINAKLVNGYTLEENQMLKNICMKLKVGNLRTIDINNTSILNIISIEEYNLLKKVFMN